MYIYPNPYHSDPNDFQVLYRLWKQVRDILAFAAHPFLDFETDVYAGSTFSYHAMIVRIAIFLTPHLKERSSWQARHFAIPHRVHNG